MAAEGSGGEARYSAVEWRVVWCSLLPSFLFIPLLFSFHSFFFFLLLSFSPLWGAVEFIRVFARMSPQGKASVIRALQKGTPKVSLGHKSIKELHIHSLIHSLLLACYPTQQPHSANLLTYSYRLTHLSFHPPLLTQLSQLYPPYPFYPHTHPLTYLCIRLPMVLRTML